MPTFAAIATQLTDQTARAYRLNIGGIDFLKPYGASWATQYSVMLETIQLTEEGPGGVSSLSFTIDDPRIEVAMAAGAEVEFWDITRGPSGRPLFLGFLQSFNVRPEGVSRYIDIVCIGIECLLDWMLVPSLTIPTGTDQAEAIQSCVYNASGIGYGIRAFANVTSFGVPIANGTQAAPIGSNGATLGYDIVLAGTSLRGAIDAVIAATGDSAFSGRGSGANTTGAMATIDFYGGLRLIQTHQSASGLTTYQPTDYDTLSLDGTPTSTFATSALNVNVDASGIVRGVYVNGANAAGSGLISDGSGITGPISYISDSTSTTAATRNAIAGDYLYTFTQPTRGTASLDPTSHLASNYRPGGRVAFATDAQVFAASTTFVIYSIRKTFLGGGNESWDVDFGGFAGSAVKQIRRLTRDIRS